MDKTLSLLISASIVLIVGVLVVMMFKGSTDTFDQESNSISDQGCMYQLEKKLTEDGVTDDDINNRCEEDEDIQESEENLAIILANSN